jgi:hypothetical protein
MTDPTVEMHLLSYASPRARTSYSAGWLALVTVNALAAFASLWFVQLAVHIYSCTEGEKWCHLQALVLGVPYGLFVLVLMLVTASMTRPPHPTPDRSRRVKVTAWSLLVFAVAVLVALFAAVAHNST